MWFFDLTNRSDSATEPSSGFCKGTLPSLCSKTVTRKSSSSRTSATISRMIWKSWESWYRSSTELVVVSWSRSFGNGPSYGNIMHCWWKARQVLLTYSRRCIRVSATLSAHLCTQSSPKNMSMARGLKRDRKLGPLAHDRINCLALAGHLWIKYVDPCPETRLCENQTCTGGLEGPLGAARSGEYRYKPSCMVQSEKDSRDTKKSSYPMRNICRERLAG
jgi:hypothetical protein